VQDIDGFRGAHPKERMPRIMLIVDEFQEFFVEDDPLSQTATLLLDRLVRQGRAFGIHVLLGSQTLGGAYSLARSTLGQVAVRIALQCSESDAHLILSEENTAARLLSRPGEAIYNDANGLVEGNHPFQVAWLSDARRDFYLAQVREIARDAGIETEPPIVFEGHVASDLRRNRALVRLIEACGMESPRVATRGLTLWAGEAVSIKPPTEFTLHPRAGANVLIVGQELDSVQGLLAATFITLAARIPASPRQSWPGGTPIDATGAGPTDAADEQGEKAPACFYLLDGDSDGPGVSPVWERAAAVLPHATRIGGPRDAQSFVSELAGEVSRRGQSDGGNAAPIFLFVSNLAQFRDLRKDDDDFGFSSMHDDKPPSTGRQFAEILRGGPAVGVHVVAWCDTYANLSRWMSSATLREFEVRMAFRMSASDSSNLIDSPAASKLGSHRALLYLADRGTLEKFRPYGPPDDETLEWISGCFQGAQSQID
jgi:hypothetical protein